MELNRATIKQLLFIAFCAITFYIVLIHLNDVWDFVRKGLEILTPILIGLCIAFILNPLMELIEWRMLSPLTARLPADRRTTVRGVSVFMSIVIVIGMIALLVLLIVPEVEQAFSILANTLPTSLLRLAGIVNGFLDRFEMIDFRIPIGQEANWMDLLSTATEYISNALENGVLRDLANTARSLLGAFMNLVLGLILSIYLLMGKERIFRFLRRLTRAFSSEKNTDIIFKVAAVSETSFRNFVTGQLTEAVIIGVLCFVGMVVFRFPYPTATSAVIGMTALIPVFGAWVGGIFGALLSLSHSVSKALLFVVFLIILQQLETNLIYPRVVGKTMGLPGILVLVSVLLGAGVGGVLGMLLAVPICSVLYTLLSEAMDRRLAKKKALGELEDLGLVSPEPGPPEEI